MIIVKVVLSCEGQAGVGFWIHIFVSRHRAREVLAYSHGQVVEKWCGRASIIVWVVVVDNIAREALDVIDRAIGGLIANLQYEQTQQQQQQITAQKLSVGIFKKKKKKKKNKSSLLSQRQASMDHIEKGWSKHTHLRGIH